MRARDRAGHQRLPDAGRPLEENVPSRDRRYEQQVTRLLVADNDAFGSARARSRRSSRREPGPRKPGPSLDHGFHLNPSTPANHRASGMGWSFETEWLKRAGSLAASGLYAGGARAYLERSYVGETS